MGDLLQFVTAENTTVGQRVKFPGKRAWWKITSKEKSAVVLKKGSQINRVDLTYKLLQEPFENLS